MVTYNDPSDLRPLSWRAAFAAWFVGSIVVWLIVVSPFVGLNQSHTSATIADPGLVACQDGDDACLGNLAPAAGQ